MANNGGNTGPDPTPTPADPSETKIEKGPKTPTTPGKDQGNDSGNDSGSDSDSDSGNDSGSDSDSDGDLTPDGNIAGEVKMIFDRCDTN